MSDIPNKSEQVVETDMSKSENDHEQDVCYDDILSKDDGEKVISEIGVCNDVQQTPAEPGEICALDAEKTKPMLLSSPLSSANVAHPPLSSIPVTDGESGESAAVATSPSDAWVPPLAPPRSELREEREEITASRSIQIPEKTLFDATPVDLPCGPDSGALRAVAMATCDSGHHSCLVQPSSAETDMISQGEDAVLPVTPLTTCVEPITPTLQTAANLVSPVSYSADMLTLSALVDQFSPDDRTFDSHLGSTADELEASEPVIFLRPDAPTPVPLADSLADHSSPSFRGQHSDLSTSPTTPLSSPRTEFDTVNANDEAGEGTVDLASETYDFPTGIMSSPGLGFGRGAMLSSSPPQQTTGAKRPAYDDSCDEDWTSRRPIKRIQVSETMSSPPRAPAPRRATLASQKLSRKKLAAPFRSPLPAKSITAKVVTPVSQVKVPREQIFKEPQVKREGAPKLICPAVQKNLVRSSRAAAQFRSPLVKTLEHEPRPLILPSQAIMTLERKLTLLRRAVKIKRDGDENHLERLAAKWRDAAREAAYELWSIVRDVSTEGGEVRSNSRDGWGWEERDGQGTVVKDAEDEECEVQQENTLGVMLRKLGIAPETLGWIDEGETFVDGDDVCD